LEAKFQKVNVKNSFEVDIDYMDGLSNAIKHDKEEKSWVKVGDAIGSGAKVYGLRVDNVHQDTYKVLGLLNHSMKKSVEDGDIEENNAGKNSSTAKKKK
jgi:condensin complex subunit 2